MSPFKRAALLTATIFIIIEVINWLEKVIR